MSVDLAELPSVNFLTHVGLPTAPGIYFALGQNGEVLYIGRAVNIAARWTSHHRAKQLDRLGCTRLAWLSVGEPELLPEIETAMIAHFTPRLNGTAVEDQARKLASLRLDHDVMDRIDAVMLRFYRQAGGVAPSRNAQLEAWVMEGLERMENRAKGEEKT